MEAELAGWPRVAAGWCLMAAGWRPVAAGWRPEEAGWRLEETAWHLEVGGWHRVEVVWPVVWAMALARSRVVENEPGVGDSAGLGLMVAGLVLGAVDSMLLGAGAQCLGRAPLRHSICRYPPPWTASSKGWSCSARRAHCIQALQQCLSARVQV